MATHHRGNADEIRALNVYIKLMRAAATVASSAYHQISGYGLTPSQFGVMEALHHLGPLPPREIARKLWTSCGNLTTVLANLERQKLVVRKPVRNDRRSVVIHLTAPGKRLIKEIFPGHAQFIRRLMEHLTAAEQEQLDALCGKLGRAIQHTTSEHKPQGTQP